MSGSLSASVVSTVEGQVRGEVRDGVSVFRGIRYAQAPVGELRFRPPQPVSAWGGVREALDFAPVCPQVPWPSLTQNNYNVQDEDCLAVNVWTPSPDGAKRPVMVWIHGGGLLVGSARDSWYDCTRLATRGDVVLVTLQYRLGVFGFTDVSGIGGAAYAESGNAGVLDQIAALEWVQRNIAAFGGDPENVTVFGLSAGGSSVAVLLASPLARGLFAKAIIQSMGPQLGTESDPESATARALMASAGVDDLVGLQSLSFDELLAAKAQSAREHPDPVSQQYAVKRGNAVLSEHVIKLIQAGEAASVPVLIGTTLDEMDYSAQMLGSVWARKPRPVADRQLAAAFGEFGAELAEHYFVPERGSWANQLAALLTDPIFRMPAIQLAEATSDRQPTWMYLFTYRSTSTYRSFRAAHAMELPFLFGVLDDQEAIAFTGRHPARERLAEDIQSAWIAFARTGNPSANSLPEWPQYDERTRATMEFGTETRIVQDPLRDDRELWNRLPFDAEFAFHAFEAFRRVNAMPCERE